MEIIKNRLFIVGLFAVASGVAGAIYTEVVLPLDQETGKQDGELGRVGLIANNGSDIRILTREIPAVLVQANKSLQYTFSIKNETGSLVRLKKPQHSCSCTDANLDRDIIGPNEEAKLYLGIDPRNRHGWQRFVCDVPSEAGLTWRCEIRINLIQSAYFDVDRISFPNIQFE